MVSTMTTPQEMADTAEQIRNGRNYRTVTPGKPTRGGLTMVEALTWAQYYGPSSKIIEDGSGREISRMEAALGVTFASTVKP
jgi:hypothetical protein